MKTTIEEAVSLSITSSYFEKLKNNLSVDVAIVGGGPSGLVAAYYLSKNGKKVALFEREGTLGGGMWGGAMMFNKIAITKTALSILEEFNIPYTKSKGSNIYIADSITSTSSIIYHAAFAGASIFNFFSVEDIVLKKNRVSGIVVNWGPVHKLSLHVDPMVVSSKIVVDSTGHPCEITKILTKKNSIKLNTPSKNIAGEKSLSIKIAEKDTVKNTGEIFPGLFIAGMAANNVIGSYRMGPIFSSMLISGKKAAKQIETLLNKKK